MAKPKELHSLTVIAQIDDGRRESKLQKILNTHGKITSDYGTWGPDGKGRQTVISRVYVVATEKPGNLKNALANNRLVGIKLHIL